MSASYYLGGYAETRKPLACMADDQVSAFSRSPRGNAWAARAATRRAS